MKTAEQSPVESSPRSRPKGVRGKLRMVSAPVYISVMLFGMSTWIAIVGVWVEMPLLVHALPESWNLPSYLVIIIQCANLGPATYAIWDKMRQRRIRQERDSEHHQQQQQSYCDAEVIMSLMIISVAILSMLFLTLFWDRTAVVASVSRSVALLALVSSASLSCCTSSVVFLPYMAHFPPVYISAYYFGQGLSGLVPGVLGLAQHAGQEPQCRNDTNMTTSEPDVMPDYAVVRYGDPRFSVSTFFALVTVLLCVSFAAFCCLNFIFKRRGAMAVGALSHLPAAGVATELLESRDNPDSEAVHILQTTASGLQRQQYMPLFITIGIVSCLWNGILPATQTYTCLPYGDVVYRLSVSLSWVVSPLATLPNMLAPTSSLPLIVGLGVIAALLSALHLTLAAQSPYPVLQGTITGQVIVVSSVMLYYRFCK